MSEDLGDDPNLDEEDHESVAATAPAEGPVGPDDAAGAPEDDNTIRLGLAPDAVIPLILGASAILAAFSGQRPTDNPIADFALTAAFGALVPWLAGYATRSQLIGLGAVLAFFFSGFQLPAALLAGLALVGAVALSERKRFDAPSAMILQTIVGALVTHATLHLPNIRYVGTASLLAAICLAPMVVSGFQGLPDGMRRDVRRVAIWAGAFAVIATVLTGVAALTARGAVETGIEQAEDGIDALEGGDQDAAVELLESAQVNFSDASGRLGGVLALPSRVVPIVAQHSRALETAANQGQNLAAAAVQTVTTADVDQIRGSNGAIDLAIVDDVNSELTNANRVLQNAQASIRSVRSPWLIPFLDDRLESVEVELQDVVGDIDLANHATAVVPAILGADGTRTYLVLFVQPAESREFGGFVGAYGLLQATEGKLSLLESGSIDAEFGTGEALFTQAGLFPEAYFDKRPYIFPQNLTGVADLRTIADAAKDLAPQWREDPDFSLDGVMTIDPIALGGFLELTGPIAVAGRDEPIDSSNVADFLLREQYLEFDGDARDERQDALRDLAGTAFAELLSIEIPGPERLGAIFGPLARSDRLTFTTFDDFENAFLSRVLLDANLPNVSEQVEMIGWFHETGIAGKIDAYTERDIAYDVTVNPDTGETAGTLRVTYRNNAPATATSYVLGNVPRDGLDGTPLTTGTNFVNVALYTRAGVGETTVDDEPLKFEDPKPSLSYEHHRSAIEVPLSEERTILVELQGQVAPGRYDLLVAAQALAVVGDFEVTIRPTDGWRIAGDAAADDGSWTVSGPLDFHQAISVEFVADE
jgi:hypothetical protein